MINSKVYFVKTGGGSVYTFRNDSLQRIDQSFDHKMQWQANFFAHEGRIFAYGGYGFWSVREFFIYFDEALREWELFNPNPMEEKGPAIFGGYFLKSGDDFYVCDGFTINPLNRDEKLNNYAVWHFSFKNNHWTYLGKSSADFHRASKAVNWPFSHNDKLYMLNTNHIEVIEIKNNRRILYKHGMFSTTAIGDDVKIFADQNKFIIVRNENDRIKIESIDANLFLETKSQKVNFIRTAAGG
ncbi:MAG: hypothetical protein U5K51_02265 [Flavobacteriaceae bacterium]|nr:hypothetical protein [Flavobacteriaceae bacterium]